MKALVVLAIFLLVPQVLRAQTESTGVSLPPWAVEAQNGKPYVLELAYADTQLTLPRAEPGGGTDSPLTVTEPFLKEATKIRVGVLSTEAGTVELGDGCKVVFRVTRAGAGFMVQLLLQPAGRGTRIINTRFVLSEAEWVVLGGTGSEAATEGSTRFYAAIRIKTRG